MEWFDTWVEAVTEETGDIRSFRLADPAGQALPGFEAGAHVDVQTPGGPVRPYSIASSPSDLSSYVIGVKLEPQSRGGSAAMHRVGAGDTLRIRAPRNNFRLAGGGALLLAGGIGITPLLSMARVLAAEGRAFHLHYFARGEDQVAFRSALESPGLAGRVTLHPGLAPEAVSEVLSREMGAIGVEDHVYACGPAPFLSAADELAERLVAGRFHLEVFSPAGVPTDPGADTFEVVLARSGKTFTVGPAQTIAQVLLEGGVPVELSCEQGVCGTCVTPVLEGCPEHRDSYLLDDERAANDAMCICVSRAKGERLVLDL